jgi:hypothetical protein
MKKSIVILNLIFLLPVIIFAQQDLEKQIILDGKIEMLVPTAFHVMTDEEYKIKYPNPNNKATLIFTDKYLEVNMVFKHILDYDLSNEQIKEFTGIQMESIQKSYPTGSIADKGLRVVNGKTFGYFKMITKAKDQEVFNYFNFTTLDGKLLLMTFNCIVKLQKDWENTMDKMLLSIVCKE